MDIEFYPNEFKNRKEDMKIFESQNLIITPKMIKTFQDAFNSEADTIRKALIKKTLDLLNSHEGDFYFLTKGDRQVIDQNQSDKDAK